MFNETQYVDAKRRYERENTASGLIFLESLFVTLMIGFRFDSWKVGVLVFLGLIVLCSFRPVSIIFAILFSLFWSLIGVVIGFGFLQSPLLAVIFAVVFFIISIVLHLEYFRII